VLPVEVTFDGRSGEVLYCGGVPGVVAGVFQANVRVPDSVRTGDDIRVRVKVGAIKTPEHREVTIAIK
jgi:uncharacterized protein (TIGR03437 family)